SETDVEGEPACPEHQLVPHTAPHQLSVDPGGCLGTSASRKEEGSRLALGKSQEHERGMRWPS
ncbi:hypothetical protein P7K49_032516, partial [Saguinus oedipus]